MRALEAALLAWVVGTSGAAEAATLQATFTGTVTSGSDVTGTFLTPGSSFNGESFSLTFTYGQLNWPTGGRTGDSATFDQAASNSDPRNPIPSPIKSAILTIAGKAYSLLPANVWGTTSGAITAYLTSYHVEAGNRVRTCAFGSADLRYPCGPVPEPYADTTWREDSVSASFLKPFSLPNIEEQFSADLGGRMASGGGLFDLSECAYNASRLLSCSRDTSGVLSVSSLTVATPVPLPASAWLLGAVTAAFGALGWQRRGAAAV